MFVSARLLPVGWNVVESVEDYLKRAAEAEASAARISDLDLRRQFLELAEQWRSLAGQAVAWRERYLLGPRSTD